MDNLIKPTPAQTSKILSNTNKFIRGNRYNLANEVWKCITVRANGKIAFRNEVTGKRMNIKTSQRIVN